MLDCLYVSAYKNSSPCTDFHGIFYWGVYKNLLMFQFLLSGRIIDIIEYLYEFLSTYVAIYGQEIALQKSCRSE